jgi:hypothetical protein
MLSAGEKDRTESSQEKRNAVIRIATHACPLVALAEILLLRERIDLDPNRGKINGSPPTIS